MGKFNLASTIETRDGLLLQDPLLINAFIGDGDGNVEKRPGINTALATYSGQAQGGIGIAGIAYFFNADVLHTL